MTTTYEKGLYQAQILGQGFEASAAKGTPYFFLQIRILGRYDAQGQLQPCPQYERTICQYLGNEVGVTILLAQLRSIGVVVTDLTQLDPATPGHFSLVGRRI